MGGSEPKPHWNFNKYLLDKKGQPVTVFESAVEPEDQHRRSRS
jgi:glutathione peroxidase-family protein